MKPVVDRDSDRSAVMADGSGPAGSNRFGGRSDESDSADDRPDWSDAAEDGPDWSDAAEDRPDGGTGGEPTEESVSHCRVCGSPIDTTDWHPAATSVDGGGEFHLHVFCSEGCQERWRSE